MKRSASTRGWSVLEIVAACTVTASVALVFFPAFFRELRASKQAEAAEGVTRMAAGAIACAAGKPPSAAFPAPAPLTPGAAPRGTREVDPPGIWDHPSWEALGFRASEEGVPHAYAFQFSSANAADHASFAASAHGDLDGDGTTSSFELRGVVDDARGPRVEPSMKIEAELE